MGPEPGAAVFTSASLSSSDDDDGKPTQSSRCDIQTFIESSTCTMNRRIQCCTDLYQ